MGQKEELFVESCVLWSSAVRSSLDGRGTGQGAVGMGTTMGIRGGQVGRRDGVLECRRSSSNVAAVRVRSRCGLLNGMWPPA